MTVAGLCKRISALGFTLVERGYALDSQYHPVQNAEARSQTIEWARSEDAPSLFIPDQPKIDDYLDAIRLREYSYLMNDGGMVQVLYRLKSTSILKHRLIYWPCPFDVEPYMKGNDDPILDILEAFHLEDTRATTVLRGMVRFDFDPSSADLNHPASHATMNLPLCRIPVHAPLSFDTFMRFVLENFYPDAWEDSRVKAHLGATKEPLCLDKADRGRIHFAWFAD